MEFVANGPAVLGAIMMSVALGSWSLGRWQGGVARFDDAAPPAPPLMPAAEETGETPPEPAALRGTGAAACQDAARAERRIALAAADSLGELHAEISAYRRAQRVLVSPDGDELRLRQHFADVRSECRYLGLMGEPTCSLAAPARSACTLGTRCSKADPLPPGPPRPERPRQPSPAASGLTRV